MATASKTTIPEPRKTWGQWQKANIPSWIVTLIAIPTLIYIIRHWSDPGYDAFNKAVGWVLLCLSIAVIIICGFYVIIYRYWKYTRDGKTY